MSPMHWFGMVNARAVSRMGSALALTLACAASPADPMHSQTTVAATLHLSGHVLPALARASAVTATPSADPLTLTIVLKRDDEAGFQQFLHDLYDPASPAFRHFLSPAQIAERFGPSQEAYDQVSNFLRAQNFGLIEASANRMTLTVGAARADVERTFAVHIGDYALGDHKFHANVDEPVLPTAIGNHVQAVLGLSNLARPVHVGSLLLGQFEPPENNLAFTCKLAAALSPVDSGVTIAGALSGAGTGGTTGMLLSFTATFLNYQCAADELNLVAAYVASLGARPGKSPASNAPIAAVSAGSGQKIALAEFDTYNPADVQNYLTLVGHPDRISQLSQVPFGAGADFTVEGEGEVLLDIDTVLTLAPGADVFTYGAGFRGQGSFQVMFNHMISDGVDVISNSWAYCEDQTSQADLQSLDAILQTAAASGITVLTGAGDSGSTCLDGSPNTVAVPAGSPNITAVGGTTSHPGVVGTYGSETWWDGSQQNPATGQGGFGVSGFFNRPTYQSALNPGSMRSVPDVTAPADPAQGVLICQADNGGCPTSLLYGGTSIAAPIMAASVAVLNQTMATQLGFLNPQLYPLANGSAFHSAASMGSNFAHVGLGSPNFNELRRLLGAGSTGPANLTNSAIVAFPSSIPADGTSEAGVAVIVLDSNFYNVSGQNIALTANAGSQATITAINGTTDVGNGAARFIVNDTASETVTLTAATAGGNLAQTAQIAFVGPAATGGGIVAFPTTQTADGTRTSTITVTLVHDAHGDPSPGKQVLLAQNANSVIIGANPVTTDNNGQAQFAVTDQVQETAVYTAVDVSDDNLPIPQSASVTFNGGPGIGCGIPGTPVAGPGYAISVYASGFPTQANFGYGGITVNGCTGIGGIAFDSAGNLFASDYITGDVYKIPSGGGIAGAGNRITTASLGPSLGGLTMGVDGSLYATQVATSVSATTGAVLKIDKTNGTASVIVPNVPCPSSIVTDPLSEDLFVSDFCFNGTQENDSIWRISSPGSASPTMSVYAETVIPPNGSLSFAPDGTLYAVYGYTYFGGLFDGIDQISGTNGPAVPAVQSTGVSSSFSALALGGNPAGGAQSLIVGAQNTGGYAHSVAVFDMTVTPPIFSGTTLVQSDVGATKILGPDGCVYLASSGVVYRLTNADGSCPLNGLAPNPSMVLNPEIEPTVAMQGSSIRFDVSFPHTPSLPPNTQVTYVISGANGIVGAVTVGVTSVSFAYTGRESGNDTVVAFAQIDGTTVTSNAVPVTWTPAKHTSFLNLNDSPSSGAIGSTTIAAATLLDESVVPPVPIAGATVQFTLAGQSCSASTDADGHVSCSIAVSALTQCTLVAAYAGDSQYLPTTASELFAVSSFDVIFADGFEARLQGGGCVLY